MNPLIKIKTILLSNLALMQRSNFMKRALCIGMFWFLIGGHCFADNVMTIRADYWYPMNGNPRATKPGYMIELARAIMHKHGYKVDYKLLPWKRSLKQVNAGKFDCVVGAYKDDSRELIFPEEEWGIDQVDFYKKKQTTWQYSGIDSLKTINIGVIGGYAYEKNFDKFIAANKNSGKIQIINENNALELNIKKLLLGRITATPESIYVMNSKLQQMGLTNKIVSAGTLTGGEKMYIACSPVKESSKTFVKWIDEGTRTLRTTGEFNRILSRYGLKDWKPKPPNQEEL